MMQVKKISDNEIYFLIKYTYKERSLESSETPVLYRGRTVPKVKGLNKPLHKYVYKPQRTPIGILEQDMSLRML